VNFPRRLARWVGAHSQALGLSFLVALGATAVFWFFAFSVPGRREAAIDGWRWQLSQRADHRRDLLDRRISERVDNARFVATFPSVRALVLSAPHESSTERSVPHINAILSDFRNVYGERSISICDSAGAVLVSSDGPAPGAESIALAREAMRSGKPRVDLVREPDGFIGFVVAAPVAGGIELAEGGAAGAVLVVGDADGLLFDLLSQPVRTGRSGEVLLVRRDQESILFLSPLRFRKDPPLTFRQPFETLDLAARVALAGEDSFSAYVDYRHARILAATRRLKRAPWGLVVKVDEEEALAAFREDVLRRGLTWGGLLLVLIASAFGIWRSLVIAHEVKLARSEARFGALVEQATDAIFLFGNDGRILQANRATEVMYGWTRDELLSMHATDVRANGTRDAFRHDMETAAARGSLLVETRHRRADGSEFPVEVNMGLVKAGDETLFLSIVRDITPRKAAEARIRKLNSLLRTISEVSQLVVRATDEESLLKDVCQILVSHGGYALAWIGRADRETMRVVPVASAGDEAGYLGQIEVRWDDTPEGRGPTGTAIREGRPAIVSDIQGDPLVAPWRDLMLRHGFGSDAALPVRRGGAVTACLNVYAREKAFIGAEEITLLEELAGDISYALNVLDARESTRRSKEQLEKTQQQLVQAQKMEAVGRLAGGVAHDFNNLLTVIQGYSELLHASLANDPERRESLAEIVKAAGRAAALTRQLLAFSRKQVLEPKVVHLGEIVRETGSMLERLIGEGIGLALVVSEDLATVKADPGQIEQVVLNLAVNARDAMPSGGQLAVSVGSLTTATPLEGFPDQLPAGRWVLLTMEDTGSGMDAETLSHAFEPFFTTKERGKGTGLGLSTVYGIVRQSGGHVQLMSVPGKGTTFQIYLPRSDERRVSGAHSSVSAVPGSETVLVVEDEPAVRSLVQAVLERHGYIVLVAEDGAGALDVVDKHPGPIHVLLTDIVMPGMNGRDLAGVVTARRPSIRVIFMSGYTADIPTDLGVEGGPLFLSKPFSEQALTSKLREAFDAPPA
jgi:PAS domain S-box-containing protein